MQWMLGKRGKKMWHHIVSGFNHVIWSCYWVTWPFRKKSSIFGEAQRLLIRIAVCMCLHHDSVDKKMVMQDSVLIWIFFADIFAQIKFYTKYAGFGHSCFPNQYYWVVIQVKIWELLLLAHSFCSKKTEQIQAIASKWNLRKKLEAASSFVLFNPAFKNRA